MLSIKASSLLVIMVLPWPLNLKKRKGQRDLLIANVTPGEPSKIAGTDVEITGEAAEDETLQHSVKTYPKKAS